MSSMNRFPGSSRAKGFERIQSTYTVREISRQFGLSQSSIRRWTRTGAIPAVADAPDGEARYDFFALTRFRRVRELRNRGLTLRQIESELHGQLNLFPERGGRLIPLPVRRSPFEEALVLHELGDRRAAEMYRLAIIRGECVSDAYCNLGILAFEANEIPDAFDHFTKTPGTWRPTSISRTCTSRPETSGSRISITGFRRFSSRTARVFISTSG